MSFTQLALRLTHIFYSKYLFLIYIAVTFNILYMMKIMIIIAAKKLIWYKNSAILELNLYLKIKTIEL